MALIEMPIEERPREKALSLGIESLSNYELVALILGFGCKNEDVLEIAKKLINDAGGINNLSKISYHELIEYVGISKAKALSLKASFELGKRIFFQLSVMNFIYKNALEFYEHFKETINNYTYENFFVFIVDQSNRIKSYFIVSKENECIKVEPLNIIKKAYDLGARRIIVAHNHLNGDSSPSLEDMTFTEKIEILSINYGVTLLDHIIISSQNYFSFKCSCLLN
jgi:DNA repair protein RadC